jgi:hypothetical protein
LKENQVGNELALVQKVWNCAHLLRDHDARYQPTSLAGLARSARRVASLDRFALSLQS